MDETPRIFRDKTPEAAPLPPSKRGTDLLWIMAALALPLLLVLAASARADFFNPEPTLMGKDKYMMTFWGPDANGPPKAMEFCKSKGFAYAEVVNIWADHNRIIFICMH